MAEWFKAAVLKTVGSETGPGVRIPLSPPTFASLRELDWQATTKVYRTLRSECMRSTIVTIAVYVATRCISGQGNVEKLKDPAQLNERAPDQFRARFDTSQGEIRHCGASESGHHSLLTVSTTS